MEAIPIPWLTKKKKYNLLLLCMGPILIRVKSLWHDRFSRLKGDGENQFELLHS